MHARMNMLIGDPQDRRRHTLSRTHGAPTRGGTAGLPGNGSPVQQGPVIRSYWETAGAMAGSEQAVQTARKHATERLEQDELVGAVNAPGPLEADVARSAPVAVVNKQATPCSGPEVRGT
jgi:hypothetical protein